jgi:hypothetical protein
MSEDAGANSKKADYRWKPGQSGNASGRPKLTEQERVVNQLTKETWNELCEKMMTCSRAELVRMIESDEASNDLSYEARLFILHMLHLGNVPDWTAYEKYLARRIGKVKDEIDLTATLKLGDTLAERLANDRRSKDLPKPK